MKYCAKCDQDLPLSDYHKDKSKPDGLSAYCKSCKIRAAKIWYEENHQHILLRRALYRSAHPDRVAEIRRNSYQTHRARRAAEVKQYRIDNPEKARAHDVVRAAKRRGDLIQQPCERCGQHDLVHAHHDDYDKPLEVIWLCPIHHKARHAELAAQQ